MTSIDPVHNQPTALLSAASATRDAQSVTRGQLVLAHQIAALRGLGIRSFLIEVDAVPRTLLEMADRLTRSGFTVDFVRSTQDLQTRLSNIGSLIVQAEGLYIAPELLSMLLGEPGAFISTVDGRAENEAFERMDLNTRWSGFAVVGADTVANIGELPDGWSITSSMLRQAMQDGVAQRPLKQQHIQHGELRRVHSAAEAELLNVQIMKRRAGREPGFIEAKLFASVAAKLALSLEQIKSRSLLADSTAMMLAAATVGLAGFGMATAALVVGFGGIFANSVRLALGHAEPGQQNSHLVEGGMWLMLAVALMFATSGDVVEARDGLFSGSVVAGLTLLARQLRLPGWAQKSLQSPALIAVLLLLITQVGGVAMAAMVVAVLQLLLLIIAKWSHRPQS